MFGFKKKTGLLFFFSHIIAQDCSESEIELWNNCYSIDSTIILDLTAQNLYGTIPTSIGQLVNLTYLNLSSNNLAGLIPDEIGYLINLEYLYLQNNELNGPIPGSIGNLTKLVKLKLYSNQLNGNIPNQIGSLDSLVDLSLYLNNLSGEIPHEIGYLSKLERLYLFRNDLTGSIPSQIGGLVNLTHLFLHGNQLSGQIPESIGNLTKLNSLYLYENQLTGLIPSSLVDLVSLNYFWIHENRLNGELPCNICEMQLDLDNSSFVKIQDNEFCSPYPNCMLTNIGYQDTANCILIPERQFYIYDECYIIDDTDSLNLSNNNLSGSIPSDIGRLINLEYLYLNGNEFSGQIPVELGNLENLKHLYLYDNELTGEIPPEFGNLTNLTNLFLHENQLSGELPLELYNLNELQYLYLNDNLFSGFIDSNICQIGLNWTSSLYFNLSNNSFCPPYPECLDNHLGYQDISNCNESLLLKDAFPNNYLIHYPYPNPSNSSIIINYLLSKSSFVKIIVYDVFGKKIKTLFEGNQSSGIKKILWDGRNSLGAIASSGTYIYNIQIDDYVATKKVILLK